MKTSIDAAEKRFAERLREEREKAHISQLDLGMKAGLSLNLVNFIETGKRRPNLHSILKICEALAINPAVLFTDPDTDKAEAKSTVIELINRYM